MKTLDDCSPEEWREAVKAADEYSPWFPGEIYPVRNGAYQRNFGLSHADAHPRYCKFEDGEWYSFGETHRLAEASRLTVPNHWLEWRGLARNPKP
jgi:hypothetical protein